MKQLLLILLTVIAFRSEGQITVDTTKTTVTVKEKTPVINKTLTIYRSYIAGSGMRHQAVYQPVADDLGEEPESLKLSFADEVPHFKKMMDAALAKKQYNFSSLSMNLLPFEELANKLIDIYSNSTDWNDYVKKATNLKQTTTLFDGSEVAEVHYYAKMAKYVMDKSDFAATLNELLKPYGYSVASINFPEEHQQVFSADKLMVLGKNPNLFIPIPDYSITLAKLKK
jgi:hypothetical protein